MSGTRHALILFTRDPLPGLCKTRLTPGLTSGQAAALHQAFLLDLIQNFRDHPRFDFLVYLLAEDSGPSEFWKHQGVDIRMQRGRDLGERMQHAFRDCLNLHYQKAVLIGSDIPTLAAGRITDAFDRLETADVVIGPTHDGGYYLIGLSRADQNLFSGIPWGTAGVYELTLARIRKESLNAEILAMEYDIDDYEDLLRLRKALAEAEHSDPLLHAPHTKHFLKTLSP
jgi:rSAM/selenodomain-associated transferase 1